MHTDYLDSPWNFTSYLRIVSSMVLDDILTSFLYLSQATHQMTHLMYEPPDVRERLIIVADNMQWPLWKKDMILLITSVSASVVGAYGPMLGPGFVEIASGFGITVSTLAQSTAWLILTLGLCVFFMNPLAKIYGKRPTYIFASVVLFVVSVWGAVADSYGSFLGSRILGAFGMAPYEVLVQATIADLYFVHQRATRLAVWNLFLLTGNKILLHLMEGDCSLQPGICGAGFISGYIIEDLGYKWTFGVC